MSAQKLTVNAALHRTVQPAMRLLRPQGVEKIICLEDPNQLHTVYW